MPRLLLAAGLLHAGLLAALLPGRHWDPDEFEHAQAAWLIAQGLTPFVDFFEHHTPLWPMLAALPAAWVDPTDPDSAWRFLLAARFASLAASAGVVAVTWCLARRLADRPTATLAACLLASGYFFILKGIEARPDPLATLLLLAASLTLARPARRSAALAGLAFGLAAMASQKVICAAPGLAAGFLWCAATATTPRTALQLAAIAAAAALLATMPVLAWLAAHDALAGFLDLVVVANLHWTRAFAGAAWTHLVQFAKQDPLLVALSGAGAVGLAIRPTAMTAMVLLPLASLAAGAFALPVVQEQYFVMAIPYMAIAAAWATRRLLGVLPRRPAATVFALLLLAGTARNLHDAFARDGDETRARLVYLLTTTPPDATVMAAWSTGIAFRRPAWFYFFLHPEVQAHIPPAAYAALAAALRDGRIRPDIVDLDAAMALLPPDVLAAIQQHYAPTGVASLLRRHP